MARRLVLERSLLLESTKNEWESGAVFNPTAIEEDETTHLIYRAVRSPNYSSLGHAEIIDGTVVRRHEKPFMTPSEEYEREGVEDPRITKIDGTYYLLYTAWNGNSARIAYASGPSIDKLEKKGIISPNITVEKAIQLVDYGRYKNVWTNQSGYFGKDSFLWDKDAVLFPEKISGKFALLQRLEPYIQLVLFYSFEDLQNQDFWEDYIRNIESHVFMQPQYGWEFEKIGAGATPIKIDDGWLLLYHGVGRDRRDKWDNRFGRYRRERKFGRQGRDREHLVYSAGAALVSNDLDQVARLREPLFRPEYEWEKNGSVNDVVFPEGAVLKDSQLEVYYGSADKVIGLARIDFKSLINRLLDQRSLQK